MGLRLVQEAQDEPVALEDVKEYLRLELDETDEDVLIQSLIKAARQYGENYMRRSLAEQTWELTLDSFPDRGEIRLPRPPLIQVESFTYKDKNGTEFDFTDFVLDTTSEPGRVVLSPGKDWPSVELWPSSPIRIQYRAGYTQSNPMPKPIIQGLQFLVTHFYENRDFVIVGTSAMLLPFTVDALWSSYRVWGADV